MLRGMKCHKEMVNVNRWNGGGGGIGNWRDELLVKRRNMGEDGKRPLSTLGPTLSLTFYKMIRKYGSFF